MTRLGPFAENSIPEDDNGQWFPEDVASRMKPINEHFRLFLDALERWLEAQKGGAANGRETRPV